MKKSSFGAYTIAIIILAIILTSLVWVLVDVRNDDTYEISFNKSDIDYESIEEFYEVLELLGENYIDGIDLNELLEGATAGLADALGDKYTMYVPLEEMLAMNESAQGEYAGIGVVITNPSDDSGGAFITTVYSDGPADMAGVLPGDLVIGVDGEDISSSKSLEYIASKVKGDIGSNVELKIYRAIENEVIDITIKRGLVNSIEVTGYMEEDNIGYINISSFSRDSDEEFLDVFNELGANGMKALIVDVRDNGGGDYYSVLNITDMILEEGLITYTIDKFGNKEEQYANPGGIDIPMVVLTNEYSASASELFAGALKDHEIATIVGTTTYGKGLVQSVNTLKSGAGLRVTIAKYYTPSGICIQDIGVVPNVVIEPLEDYEFYPVVLIPREDDVQLDKAIEILKDEMK